ncbi:hypothetical protein N665_0611s0030 [Sinapis alba]|nr:hypothetical protein N665_0611s0030 [Sinapis alba]
MSRSTEAPYTKSSRLHLGAAPSCASGTTGSTHPGHGLARSGRVCVSEAPPPLLSVSVLSTYSETPFCCFSTDFISAGYPRRSYISTYAAHLRRSGTGDASPLCCILVSSEWSPDLTTTSISNHCSSLTLVNYLVGLVFAVCSPVFESVPARKGPYGDKPYRVYLMTSPSTTSFCAPSFYSLPHPGRETGRTVYVFPMCCVPTPIFWKMTQNHVARRPNHAKAFYLLLDVCSHTFNQNKCDDSMLRSLSVTTCWDQHGNVDFRGLDPIKPSALSSNLISLSASVGVKLELEIHLVSSVYQRRFRLSIVFWNNHHGNKSGASF